MSRNISRKNTNTINIDSNMRDFIQGRIAKILARKNGTWNGTMTELNAAITTGAKRSTPSNWPKSPAFLRRVVNNMVYTLRRSGIKTKFGRTTDRMRTRYVSFVQN